MKTLFALLASVRLALGLPSQDQQIDVVAAVLWAEARSEGAAGIDAVAEVIRNRTLRPLEFDDTAYGVVTQARQFACLNHISARELVARAKGSSGLDRTMWYYSRIAAEELATDSFGVVSVGDALFFSSSPSRALVPFDWKRLTYVTTIGRHHFYR